MAATAVGQPDMRQFYKQSDFADVTIKFGDKKIPAHRVILCARSTYFKKALGPASPFQESQTGICSLEGDDAEAVESMLRFLYGFPYALDKTPADDTQQTWERHLNVAIVADKYDLPDLEKFAFDACTVDIRNRDSQDVDVSHLIKRAADYHDRSGALSGVTLGVVNAQFVSLFPKTDVQAWLADRPEDREALMVSHFDELMKTETFREMLRTDGEMALRHLDRLHSEAGHRGDDCKSEADDAFWGLYGKKEKKARKKLRHQGEVGSNDGYDAWP